MENIIITGGSSGIGSAYLNLSSKNTNFHILTRNDKFKSLENRYYYCCDLTSSKDIENFIKAIKKKKIKIDGLIHSAGVTLPLEKNIDFDDWEETLKVNFFSLSKLVHGIKDDLSKNSSIVLISSIGGVMGFENNPSYQISKAAIIQYTKSLSVDLAPITRVNCLIPGYVKTNMTSKSFNDLERRQLISKKTLLNRWGEPEEIANVINFLISKESSYINGQSIFVDGGWTVKGM